MLAITPTLSFTLTSTDQIYACSYPNFTLIIHPSINVFTHPPFMFIHHNEYYVSMPNASIQRSVFIVHTLTRLHWPRIHQLFIHTHMHVCTHSWIRIHPSHAWHPRAHPPSMHACMHAFTHLTYVCVHLSIFHASINNTDVDQLYWSSSTCGSCIHPSPVHTYTVHVPVHHPLIHPSNAQTSIYQCIHNIYHPLSNAMHAFMICTWLL